MNLLVPGIYTSLQLFVIIGIGYAARKLNIIREGFQQIVSRFLVKIALPVYFFASFARSDLSVLKEGVWVLVAGVVIFGVGFFLAWLVFLLLPLDKKEKRAGIAMAGLGNSGYMPLTILQLLPVSIPFVASQYNAPQATVYIGVYLILSSPLLWSVGNNLIARHEVSFSFSHLLSPPTIGILLGLIFPVLGIGDVFSNSSLPFFYIVSALDRLGTVIFPMILITLGVMIADISFHHEKTVRLSIVAGAVAFVRFICIPALFFVLNYFFLSRIAVPSAIMLAIFLEAHNPPATNFSAMAVEGKTNEDVTAFTLLISYIAYILILPVYLMLFLGVK